MNPTLEGVRAIPFKGVTIRSSFDEAKGSLIVQYGSVSVTFPIAAIPSSDSLNINLGMHEAREVYLEHLFKHVLHASLEFYVLALKAVEHQPVDASTRRKVGEQVRERLCNLFSSRIRNQDLVVTCSDINNPVNVVEDEDIVVTVYFKAGASTGFHPIEISQRYH